jgi:phosphonopyruvate decarboxylase
MINPSRLIKIFEKNKINSYSGVPDSVLKNFLSELSIKKKQQHYVCVNEGSAVAFAIGNYLGSKKLGLVYLQNSGLGNAINPIISIADKKVYSIPMILLIGWRGAPGLDDEPQHLRKGSITIPLLKQLQIKYILLKDEKDFSKINSLITFSKKNKVPVAILVKKNSFEKKIYKKEKIYNQLPRQYFLKKLLESVKKRDNLISSTGYTSRELYELRRKYNIKNGSDFYLVGGMGHTASVALGNSMAKKKSTTICIDGDGSFLMHMGSLATAAYYGKKNFKYILLNNYAHESVGGQKTNSQNIDMKLFSKSLGFKSYQTIKSKKNLENNLSNFLKNKGSIFLEVLINTESMDNLGRPKNLKNVIKNFIS